MRRKHAEQKGVHIIKPLQGLLCLTGLPKKPALAERRGAPSNKYIK
jgi:hypothetical protein